MSKVVKNALMLVVVMIALDAGLQAKAAADADGAAKSVIAIASIEDLQRIGNDPAYPLDGSYVLTQDIDASATATWNSGAGFAPIGSSDPYFTGTFDGQGHVISELTINRPDQSNVGLFGGLGSAGQVKNLGLHGGAIQCGASVGANVGGLVGANAGTVTQCYASDTVSGVGYVGGLVGANAGTVTQCYASDTVSGVGYVGGLVGWNQGGTVTQCYATGTVSGPGSGYKYCFGGLVGGSTGPVTQCYATGVVSCAGTSSYVGGLVGNSTGTGTVTQCYATGAVSCAGTYSYVGGLIGVSSAVTQCYATGAVSGSGSVGGLTGANYKGVVTQSYATGAVSGSGNYAGGLVGQNYEGTVTDSYWDTQTSGMPSSDGGTGETTAQMMSQATFVNWDFATVWRITEGKTYPLLQWAPVFYTLTASVSGGHGTISPTSGVYAYGNTATLTATPDMGYQVKAWTGTDNDATTAEINTVTMTSDKTVTVEFSRIPFLFTEIPGSGQYNAGDSLLLTVGFANAIGAVEIQWTKNGVDIPGAESETFSIPVLGVNDTAAYCVRVTEVGSGEVYPSPPAIIAVMSSISLPVTTPLALALSLMGIALAGMFVLGRATC